MKLLLIVALFAFLQAAAPIPGKAPESATPNSQKFDSKTSSEKTPSSQPKAVPKLPNSSTKEQNASSLTNQNEGKPIITKVLPVDVNPVTVSKDKWDYGYIAAMILLTLATFAIASYAVVQAKATRIAANAAQASADALVNIERGWLLLEAITPQSGAAVGHSRELRIVQVKFINRGNSLVWVTESALDFAVTAQEELDSPLGLTIGIKYPDGIRVAPRKPIFAHYTGVRISRPSWEAGPLLDTDEVYKLYEKNANLFVRGFIRYRDIFGKSRESHFHARLRWGWPWEQIGPDGSNKYT